MDHVQGNLTREAIAVKQSRRIGYAGKGQHRVPQRPQLPGGVQPGHLFQRASVLLGKDKVPRHVFASGRQQVLRLGNIDNADHPAERFKYLRGVPHGGASDGAADHVHPRPAGELGYAGDVVVIRVVDELCVTGYLSLR